MAKKRKSRGRKKGQSGRGKSVQCSKCGRIVPVDKVKTVTKRIPLVDRDTEFKLRKDGGYISSKVVTQKLCISCAVHTHKVNIRPKNERTMTKRDYKEKREDEEFRRKRSMMK